MYLLFFKGNSEFNTGNTDIKLGVGEQGKKQSPGVWGVSGTAVGCDLMPFGLLCHQPLQALFFILPHSDTSQAPVTCWHTRRADPSCAPGQLGSFQEEFCSTLSTPLSNILNFLRTEIQFSPLEIHPPGSPCKDGGCLGSDLKCLTHLLFQSYTGCVPPPVLTLYDFICASGGGWLNIRREREHSIKLQAEKVCQLFFFSWLLGCTDSFWQFPLFCAHKISLIAEFSLR